MKHISQSDRKKLKPLTRYWKRRMFSDNWYILALGVVLGFILGKI